MHAGKPATVRTFIAIPVTESVIRALIETQRGIQSHARANSIRWCKPEQFHLTLNFLGEVEDSRIDELRALLDQTCDGIPRFQLALTALGCFPNERRPRVLWACVSGDLPVLQRLQQKVADATDRFRSSGSETTFHPHITIGRIPVQQRGTGTIGDVLKKQLLPATSGWETSEVELMASTHPPREDQSTNDWRRSI